MSMAPLIGRPVVLGLAGRLGVQLGGEPGRGGMHQLRQFGVRIGHQNDRAAHHVHQLGTHRIDIHTRQQRRGAAGTDRRELRLRRRPAPARTSRTLTEVQNGYIGGDNVTMHTFGVNLTAQPSRTWLAVIEWVDDTAELVHLQHGAEDPEVIGMAMGPDIVGINCPFGWPRLFVEFLTKYTAGQEGGVSAELNPMGQELRYRLTDHIVNAIAPGARPPSPSSGGTAAATLRCATILAKSGQPPASFDPNGKPGNVFEVYPPASLSQWGLPYKGYRGATGQPLLSSMVTKMVKYKHYAGPWLRLGRWLETCRNEADAFEAVVASLSARAIQLDRAIRPAKKIELQAAAAEGWIWVPNEESLPSMSRVAWILGDDPW
jgi:hypothetical protein